MVFFLIFRFILSKTDFQEHDRNNQVGFILLTGATICLNSVHQMIDSFPAIHIFKSIRVLIMYGLLLLLFLYVDHAVCLLVGFDTFFPIVIMGLSKCIQIIFTIDIYCSISIRGALRSIDKLHQIEASATGFFWIRRCSMRWRIQHDSDFFCIFYFAIIAFGMYFK